jgi:hypothetical protein
MSEIAEQTALAAIRQRLAQEFPRIAAADVDAAVRQAHSRFDNSSIRDFIPLFVEKNARHQLSRYHLAANNA